MQPMILFQFKYNSNIDNWKILDDVVMGGRSDGNFKVNTDGHGEFSGKISLDNNGGFSSLRYYFETVDSSKYSKFKIRIKGDGKTYQFRVKNDGSDKYSYIYSFKTSSEWQAVEIPFDEMYASFRGYRLDIPNFDGKQMEEIAFLIGNKKEEHFKLLIDSITLE
ncbi:CIA30 family protein [Winogradskyella sp. WHY3]|uniref:CIA30 family protein n=2 Tax=Winogradskyella luteola TaxID=2828330 RepID=A0A9X1JM40_9FLAO|nr:CIA30 family protein [Winogradskyella luteola]